MSLRPHEELARLRDVREWERSGDVGMSAKAMVAAALGEQPRYTKVDGRPLWDHPDDLGRCLRLEDRLPWVVEGFPTLYAESEVWAAMIDNWGRLRRSMADEVGVDWSKGRTAPHTYALMQRLRGMT